jgi:hypothetical protein
MRVVKLLEDNGKNVRPAAEAFASAVIQRAPKAQQKRVYSNLKSALPKDSRERIETNYSVK